MSQARVPVPLKLSLSSLVILLVAALGVVSGTPTTATDRIVRLSKLPVIAKDLASYLRIANPASGGERKVNAALARLDDKARKAADDCRKENGAKGWWERSIDVPMRGPRFISYEVHDNVYCGWAHPDTGTMSIVYDLRTGQPIDWTKVLPPSLTGKVALAEGIDGTKMVTLASKAMHRLYLADYRYPTGKEDEADKECREAVTNPGGDGPPAMTVWLDAKEGGLAVQFDLAHVVQACADPIVIPAAILRAKGADPGLVAAIEDAHQHAEH